MTQATQEHGALAFDLAQSVGYLINDGTYRLRYRLVHLGRTTEQSRKLCQTVSLTVEALADKTDEQAYFAFEENGIATNIVVAEEERSIRRQFLPSGAGPDD